MKKFLSLCLFAIFCCFSTISLVGCKKSEVEKQSKNLKLENFDVEVINSPGHAEDCVCLLIEKNLFTRDTIFSACIGWIDLKDSSKDQMIESLEKIKEIDFETAFPGHYESATKQEILKTISFYI